MKKSFKRFVSSVAACALTCCLLPVGCLNGAAAGGQEFLLKESKFANLESDWEAISGEGGSSRTVEGSTLEGGSFAGNTGWMIEVTRPGSKATAGRTVSLDQSLTGGKVFVSAMFNVNANPDGKLGNNTLEFLSSDGNYLAGVGSRSGVYSSVKFNGTSRTFTEYDANSAAGKKHTKNQWALFQVMLDLDSKMGSYKVYETPEYMGSSSVWEVMVEETGFELNTTVDFSKIQVYTMGGQSNERIFYWDNFMVYTGEEMDFTAPLPQEAADLIDEIFQTYEISGSADGITSIGTEGEVSAVAVQDDKGETVSTGSIEDGILKFDNPLEEGNYYLKVETNLGYTVGTVSIGGTPLAAGADGRFLFQMQGGVSDLYINVLASVLVNVSGVITAPSGSSGAADITLTDTRAEDNFYQVQVNFQEGSTPFFIPEILGGSEYLVEVSLTDTEDLVLAEEVSSVIIESEDYSGLEILLRRTPSADEVQGQTYFSHTDFTADEISQYYGEVTRDKNTVAGNSTSKLKIDSQAVGRRFQPVSGDSRFSTVFSTGSNNSPSPVRIKFYNHSGAVLLNLGVDANGNLFTLQASDAADGSTAILSKLVGKSGNNWAKIDVISKADKAGSSLLVTASTAAEYAGANTVWTNTSARQVIPLQANADGTAIEDYKLAQIRFENPEIGEVYFDDISLTEEIQGGSGAAEDAAEQLPRLLEGYLGQMIELTENDSCLAVTGKYITLPQSADGITAIEWAVKDDPAQIAELNGNQLVLSQGESDQTIVLTATVFCESKNGSSSSAERDVALIVKPQLSAEEDAKATAKQLLVYDASGNVLPQSARITDTKLTLGAPEYSVNGEDIVVDWKSDSDSLEISGNTVNVSRSSKDVKAELSGTVTVKPAVETESTEAEMVYEFTIAKTGGSSSGAGNGGSNHISGNSSKVHGTVSVPTVSLNNEPIPIEEITLPFEDMADYSWAVEAVTYLKEQGILNGVSDAAYEPERVITREEFVSALVRLFDLDTTYTKVDIGMQDVDYDSWYAPYIIAAYQFNIIQGYSEGSFGVGRPVTREEIAVMAVRMVDFFEVTLPQNAEKTFADAEQISDWAVEAVGRIQKAGIINGYEDGTYRPQEGANRAEAAKILYELLMAKSLNLEPVEETTTEETDGLKLPVPADAALSIKDFAEITEIQIIGSVEEDTEEITGNSSSKLKADCAGQGADIVLSPSITQGGSGSFGFSFYIKSAFNGSVKFYNDDLTLLELRFKTDETVVAVDSDGEESNVMSYPVGQWIKMIADFNLEPDTENNVMIALNTYVTEKYQGDDTVWEEYDTSNFTQTGDTDEEGNLTTDLGLSAFAFSAIDINSPVIYFDDIYQTAE